MTNSDSEGTPSTLDEEAVLALEGYMSILLSQLPFNPSLVTGESLERASKFMMVNNGEALETAIHKTELEAVGIDGVNGDDVEEGGGRYREVQKVAGFLRGYREAEVSRVGREKVRRLLGSVVEGGAEGLDRELERMRREGERDDDLVRFIGRNVREQEMLVAGGSGGGEGSGKLLEVLKMLNERVKVEAKSTGGTEEEEEGVKNLKLLAELLKTEERGRREIKIKKELGKGKLER